MNDADSAILVTGTGPAGLVAALALADAGFAVRLIGPPARRDDRRTTALMTPAIEMLRGLGVADAALAEAAPLRTMRIVDATSRLVRSLPVTFRAAEIDADAFGYNIPNTALLGSLEREVAARPGIAWTRSLVAAWTNEGETVTARTEEGETFSARLGVAADGRDSPARAAAAIPVLRRSFRQAALVLNFGHAREHGFVSTEFHTETGPFTQVPLRGRRSSLVWVQTPERAEELAQADEAELSGLVEEKMQSMLGRVAVEPGRQVYPLSAALPVHFARNRIALIGEAAHVFPPIGAQGLNLGMRDVRDLVAAASEFRDDPGSPQALAAYSRRRRPDVLARAAAVDALNRSLLSDLLPAQLARSAGLGVLARLAPLRALFMREGMDPGSGFSRLREQVGRQ